MTHSFPRCFALEFIGLGTFKNDRQENMENSNTAEELLRILTRQKFIYITLFSLEQKKRQLILKQTAKDLQDLNAEEEELLKKIDRLEGGRISLLQRDSHRETRLSALIESDFFNSEQKAKARQLQADIRKLLGNIENENKRNKHLLQESREMFHSMIHILNNDQSSLYQKDGREIRAPQSKPLFLDTNC